MIGYDLHLLIVLTMLLNIPRASLALRVLVSPGNEIDSVSDASSAVHTCSVVVVVASRTSMLSVVTGALVASFSSRPPLTSSSWNELALSLLTNHLKRNWEEIKNCIVLFLVLFMFNKKIHRKEKWESLMLAIWWRFNSLMNKHNTAIGF